MRLVISPLAEKQIKKLPKFIQILVAGKIRAYASGDRTNTFPLKGYPVIYKIRTGDYRIVVRKFPDRNYIILVAHRREVYLLLKRLIG